MYFSPSTISTALHCTAQHHQHCPALLHPAPPHRSTQYCPLLRHPLASTHEPASPAPLLSSFTFQALARPSVAPESPVLLRRPGRWGRCLPKAEQLRRLHFLP